LPDLCAGRAGVDALNQEEKSQMATKKKEHEPGTPTRREFYLVVALTGCAPHTAQRVLVEGKPTRALAIGADLRAALAHVQANADWFAWPPKRYVDNEPKRITKVSKVSR
jgi:hypothetical protein